MTKNDIIQKLTCFEEEGKMVLSNYQQKIKKTEGTPIRKAVTNYAVKQFTPHGFKSTAKELMGDIKKNQIKQTKDEAAQSADVWLNSVARFLKTVSQVTSTLTTKGNSQTLIKKLNHARRAVNFDTKIRRGLDPLAELKNLELIYNLEIKELLGSKGKQLKKHNHLAKNAKELLSDFPDERQSLLGAIERLEKGGIDAYRQCMSSCRNTIENLVKKLTNENKWRKGLEELVKSDTKRQTIKKTFNFLSAYGSHGEKDPGEETAKSGVEQTFSAIRLIMEARKEEEI